MSSQLENRLEILVTVHNFFVTLLCSQLNHDFPVPNHLVKGANEEMFLRWLDLLDLAITPVALRDELSHRGSQISARALIRYYIHYKLTHDPGDRDKADFVATWIYRNPPRAGDWDNEDAFPQHLHSTVGDPVPPLPEEHRQLVREFDFIREEVDDIRTFDELTDAGIVQRVRGIKASFGSSFYHPRILAAIAMHNVHFGERFDALFHAATKEIKSFAENVASQGGSILTRVDGETTVKHLTEVQEDKILKTDYREAQEQFRKVSNFRKVVKQKSKEMPKTHAAAAAFGAAHAEPSVEIRVASHAHQKVAMPGGNLHGRALLSSTIDQIRAFIQAADPSRANIVPLSHGNFTLSPPEIEAFRTDFGDERSFRADFGRMLIALAAISARIDGEVSGYRAKQESAYLWKPHADALTQLMRYAQELSNEAEKVNAVAQQRGLLDKAKALNDAMLRLEERGKVALHLLRQIGVES